MTKFVMPTREQETNKGSFGKILSICGCDNYTGAAYLSAASALRVGAGLVTLASTPKVISTVATLLPEAIYLERTKCVKKIRDFSVTLIGCGLGLNHQSQQIFSIVLKQLLKDTIPTVIDADGLNILAQKQIKLNENFIITPHPLEAARLLSQDVRIVLADIETAAKKLTSKYNCITVLKTHRTVICNTDLSIHINKFGNSALAKSGTGDVLAGVISGLIAQNLPLFEAAKLGVYLHSRAGEIASKELSEYSVLAHDLLYYLPKAILEIA